MENKKNWRDDEGTSVPNSINNGEVLETKCAKRYQCSFPPNLSDIVMKIEDIVAQQEEYQSDLQAQLAKHRALI